MSAAARKQEDRPGHGRAPYTTSTANEEHHFEGADHRFVRMRSAMANADMRALLLHRMESRPLTYRELNRGAYIFARHLRLFKPGKYRNTNGKHWTKWQRQQFHAWRAATPEGFLKWLKIDDPTVADRKAVEDGIEAGLRAPAKGFVTAKNLAEALNVTMEERTLLSLTRFGAIDGSPEEIRAIAKAKKNESDRIRAAAKRAAAGARPRSQSYSAVKPWKAFDMSRKQFYLLDANEREAMLAEAINDAAGQAENHAKPAGQDAGTDSSRVIYIDDGCGDEFVPPADTLPGEGMITVYSTNPPTIFTVLGGTITLIPASPVECKRAFAAVAHPANEPGTCPPSWEDVSPPISADPPPTVAPEGFPQPEDEPARWDWPEGPVVGWRQGRLKIQNLLTGETDVINFRDQEAPKSGRNWDAMNNTERLAWTEDLARSVFVTEFEHEFLKWLAATLRGGARNDFTEAQLKKIRQILPAVTARDAAAIEKLQGEPA